MTVITSLVSGKAIAYVAGAAAFAFAALSTVQTVRLASAQRETAQVQSTLDKHRADAESTARAASESYRREEARRAFAQQKAINDAHTQTEAARLDADALRVALGRLRQRATVDTARRASASHSEPSTGGPAASPTTDLPTDLLGGLGEAAGQLAAYADAARIAGHTCERSFDSLTEGGQ